MQFGFMPERWTIDVAFVLRRLQEQHHTKEKKFFVFCGLRESFWLISNESVGMGNEEERNTGSFGYISNESVWGSKDKNQSGFWVVGGVWG